MARTNEEKLDLLADLMDPVSELLADEELRDLYGSGQRMQAIKTAIKGHKGAIIEILALIEGQDPATYQIEGPAVLARLIGWVNENKEMLENLFPTPAQSADAARSGQHTENTVEKGP